MTSGYIWVCVFCFLAGPLGWFYRETKRKNTILGVPCSSLGIAVRSLVQTESFHASLVKCNWIAYVTSGCRGFSYSLSWQVSKAWLAWLACSRRCNRRPLAGLLNLQGVGDQRTEDPCAFCLGPGSLLRDPKGQRHRLSFGSSVNTFKLIMIVAYG